MPPLTPRFDEALRFACQVHRLQSRKSTEVPYVTHLMAVASLVGEHGGDEDQMIAALLHDAMEDQGVTRQEIEKRFGGRVADIVEACTDTTEQPKPPWQARKERYIAHLHGATPDAKLISVADKLHNARTTLMDLRAIGPKVWERFNTDRDGTLWYYRAIIQALRDGWDHPLVDELERTVQVIADSAKAHAQEKHQPAQPKYPKPDRSDFKPNFRKTEENDTLDVAWNEGVLSDGRPFRVEAWCQDQVSHLVYFFSTRGLENADKDYFQNLLVREKLLEFIRPEKFVCAKKITDASRNEIWAVSVVVGDEDDTFVRDGLPLNPYPR